MRRPGGGKFIRRHIIFGIAIGALATGLVAGGIAATVNGATESTEGPRTKIPPARPTSEATVLKDVTDPGAPLPVAPKFAGQIHAPADYQGIALPFSSGQYNLSTIYLDTRGSDYVSLYAGSLHSDPTQGILIVRVNNAGGAIPTLPSGAFALSGVGMLTMTRVTDTVVTLSDASSHTHTFDLLTDRFA